MDLKFYPAPQAEDYRVFGNTAFTAGRISYILNTRPKKDKADLAKARGGSRGVIDELIVKLIINTGIRASELCNLNIGDLPARHGKDCIRGSTCR